MPPPRPTSVTVIAIFHLIFGTLGALAMLCVGGVQLAGGEKILPVPDNPKMQEAQELQKKRQEIADEFLAQKVPWRKAYQVGNQVLSYTFPVLLLAAGFGLLSMKPWARWLSILYAVLSCGANLVGAFFTLMYDVPAQQEAFRQIPPTDPGEQVAVQAIGTMGPLCPLVFMIYPLIVLIIMLLPSVARAFSGVTTAAPEEQSGWAERES